MNIYSYMIFFIPGDAFGEGLDAFILSIGVIIAIIVGVIIIVVVAAVAIICCCCKNKHQYRRTPKSASGRSGQERVPVEPTGRFMQCSR